MTPRPITRLVTNDDVRRRAAWNALWTRLLQPAPAEPDDDDKRPTPLHPPMPLKHERGEGAA